MGTFLGLAVACKGETLYGFDAGSFRLYVERGPRHDSRNKNQNAPTKVPS